MKNEIDSKTLLRVYEHIQKHGEQTDEGKFYEGLTAFSDVDGYTVYLQGSGVLMRFGFHNTYHLDYQSDKNKEDFIKKIEAIAKQA
ncbi:MULTISPECIES: DUF3081 domain-containing protein [Pseudoalteromonas]|uniref:DUF3081 domain-containing protein n=1 Tax=Pseudoalteromonas ruthenica TaxID=151081 RepID=A0A0F4PKT1_9GAMM|nr:MULTISPECIES: DUF3081 domain-containing protein [Pseudoalteromonas]KJY95593.1 hypothetical protein TW76_13430 [Pseudoalteromonas ruthenica]KJZ00519.1 hypothetical protein TW72_07515 [Pseudoalteromonas ruthenica]MCF2860621.1 DUF3081 domain-containing protein [Pseudoalteromonas sp. CNAT2-18]MCG7544206.1 DUF3081 domain-containing protein [Pseudoalteromonas sp. MM17-2]MCG7556490.1 DUF3081 domain-containing protein [Pseudoalteromonas sp. CNAT2-18.1]|tara:strand:- start:759 stop:1016 length:258 start_codon:yes stop_codon:yes gene_type:complete